MDTTKTLACVLVALLLSASACSTGDETEALVPPGTRPRPRLRNCRPGLLNSNPRSPTSNRTQTSSWALKVRSAHKVRLVLKVRSGHKVSPGHRERSGRRERRDPEAEQVLKDSKVREGKRGRRVLEEQQAPKGPRPQEQSRFWLCVGVLTTSLMNSLTNSPVLVALQGLTTTRVTRTVGVPVITAATPISTITQ